MFPTNNEYGEQACPTGALIMIPPIAPKAEPSRITASQVLPEGAVNVVPQLEVRHECEHITTPFFPLLEPVLLQLLQLCKSLRCQLGACIWIKLSVLLQISSELIMNGRLIELRLVQC